MYKSTDVGELAEIKTPFAQKSYQTRLSTHHKRKGKQCPLTALQAKKKNSKPTMYLFNKLEGKHVDAEDSTTK